MLLQCTKTMQNKLKLEEVDHGTKSYENDLYAWHVHMITIARRRIFVLMNNVTRYPIIIYRASDADMRHAKELFLQAIREALLEEGIDEQIVEAYTSGTVRYVSSSGMSLVSKLNALCSDLRAHYCQCFEPSSVAQPRLSVLLSHQPQLYGKRIDMPYKQMMRQLALTMKNCASANLINTRTYQLCVRIELESVVVMRRFTIPAHFTFHQLHEVITILFQWPKTMKYVFQVDEQCIEDGSEAVKEYPDTSLSLQPILEKGSLCIYQNAWKHIIELEGVIEEGHRIEPFLLERVGIRPPLNIRTEKSYLDYLKIINNPKSKRHRKLKAGDFGDRYEKPCDEQRYNRLMRKWPQTCRCNHDHL